MYDKLKLKICKYSKVLLFLVELFFFLSILITDSWFVSSSESIFSSFMETR